MTSSRFAGPDADAAGQPRIIKKYPNRRLYDTRTSAYITLVDVKAMVLGMEVFEVRDAKSGEDLTRSILLQIILEEETAGVPMFSTQMLAQIIRFYGHAMQGLMGSYLERNLQAFVDMQRRLGEQGNTVFGAEAWSQLMGLQHPAMQGLMNNYLDQSKQVLEQMHKQAAHLFPGGGLGGSSGKG